MKIADYGKAITSYIESPTTAQKLQAKEKAQTLGRTFLSEGSKFDKEAEEIAKEIKKQKELQIFDVIASGTKSGKQQIKGAPEGFTINKETIDAILKAKIPLSEKINLLASYQYGKGRDRIEKDGQEIFLGEGGSKNRKIGIGFNEKGEGVGGTLMYDLETGKPQFTFGIRKSISTGGRVHLAEGSEDIAEPSKSMQVDTTTKPLPLFTLDDFKFKANTYVGALYNGALPAADIKAALNKFTQKGIDDGTFSADDAIKVVQDLKFQFQDRAQKQRLRDNIIAGTGTVEREERAIGGGVIEGEDLGTREGFAEIYRTNKGYGPEVSTEKNVKKGFIYPRKNKDGKVLWKKAEDISKNNPIPYDFTKKAPIPEMDSPRYKFDIASNKWVFLSRAEGEPIIAKKNNETFKEFTKRINERAEEFRSKGADKRISTIIDARNKIDDWTTKWLDNNLDKYGIRKSEKFFNDLKKDYKKFIKQTFKSDKIKGVNLFSPDGLPNVSRSLTENLQPFEYDGFKTVNVGEGVTKNPTKLTPNTPYFKKIFFKNKIENTPGLFNDLKSYLKYIITNKSTLEGKKATRNFVPNKDIIYFLDSDKSGLLDSVKNDVISSLGDDVKQSYDLYKNKVNIGLNWNRNAKIIEDTLGPIEMKKLTGYKTIKEGMQKEQKLIKKFFNFKELPKDLKLGYAIDHGQGISFAARSGNKDIMKLAVKDLIGSMIQTNEVLGRGERGTISFERLRKILANKIRDGENANTNLNKLNKLVEKTYGKKNVYSIKNGVLQSSPISPTSDLRSRFISYFEKLNKTKEGKSAIKNQYGNLDNLKNSIPKLEKDILKVKKHAESKGFRLDSFAGFLDFSQAGVDLPPAVKQASENILKAGGQALKAFGKATIVLDPIFAAQDFSRAIDTGVSGDEALSYTGQKFVQDLINLPRTLEDLAYTATEKGTFKNFGDKENRIFDYKPKTFADDFLKGTVEKTDPEILKARLAKRDFDTQVLPNLTMVDDIDIPASKEEIGAAKDAFMREKDVDLSVLEKPKKSPFGKYNEQIKKLVF